MEPETGQRVVLARKTHTMIKYRWTGAEPENLSDVAVAVDLGAAWEGDELVTYDLPQMPEILELQGDEYMSDND